MTKLKEKRVFIKNLWNIVDREYFSEKEFKQEGQLRKNLLSFSYPK